jgi:hypothetical protein
MARAMFLNAAAGLPKNIVPLRLTATSKWLSGNA